MERSAAKPRAVFIVGPTACGKTTLSIDIAKRFDGEIVSADSVQVYRGFNIGAAKPTLEERRGVPHHLLDCVAPDCPDYSVSAYREQALAAIADITARGRLPFVVGGSGLYVNALVYPLNFAVPSDPPIRARLERTFPAQETLLAWKRLQELDPTTADRLHPNDRKRIIRALEVCAASGRPLSAFGNDFANAAGKEVPLHALLIGLTMDRALLYERINARVDAMLDAGLLDEVRALANRNLSRKLPAMQSIGYRQLLAYLDGEISFEEAVEAIKRETRRFAKRQIAWFKRDARIRWHDVGAASPAELLNDVTLEIKNWLEQEAAHGDH